MEIHCIQLKIFPDTQELECVTISHTIWLSMHTHTVGST